MPDVIIRGMEVPESCWTCEVGMADQIKDGCPFYWFGVDQEEWKLARHPDCPIHPAPETENAHVPQAGPSRTEWVSVEERLPEVDHHILDTDFSVTVIGFDGWNIRKAYYNYTEKVWLNGNDEEEWPEIIYWLPLPEPPTEKEAD